MPSPLYDMTVNRIDGSPLPLSEFAGRVLLVVNVASKCGLTPQYDGLEKLYERYHDRGFEVLGFPANEFMGQEPGSNAEIQSFCRLNFGVKFPMFEKLVVKGPGRHPLYDHLTAEIPTAQTAGGLKQWLLGLVGGRRQPGDISWNFEKFLISREGRVVARFAPTMVPDDAAVIAAIERELAAGGAS